MERISRVYLVRHGQVAGFEKSPIYGHTDVDVTEVGTSQLELLSERLRLADIKAIYTSDLKRSISGGKTIGRYHDVPIRALPQLRELFFGVWEGLTLSDVRGAFQDELKRREGDLVGYRAPGNGESIADLSNRVTTCFRGILSERKGDDFLLVGHGVVNRVILCHALGLDLTRMFTLHQNYGCLNIIDYYPETALVRLMNG